MLAEDIKILGQRQRLHFKQHEHGVGSPVLCLPVPGAWVEAAQVLDCVTEEEFIVFIVSTQETCSLSGNVTLPFKVACCKKTLRNGPHRETSELYTLKNHAKPRRAHGHCLSQKSLGGLRVICWLTRLGSGRAEAQT